MFLRSALPFRSNINNSSVLTFTIETILGHDKNKKKKGGHYQNTMCVILLVMVLNWFDVKQECYSRSPISARQKSRQSTRERARLE